MFCSFQNNLKTSGLRGYDFLEFWCWNLVPFLPDICFQLLKSLWSSLMYFSFNNVPNGICCSKTFSIHSAFQNMQAVHTVCTYAAPYHQRWWLLNWALITRWRSSSSLARITWNPWFPTRMSNLDSSDHRTLFHFETVHFKWALAHRTRWHFWTMFTYGFLFAW